MNSSEKTGGYFCTNLSALSLFLFLLWMPRIFFLASTDIRFLGGLRVTSATSAARSCDVPSTSTDPTFSIRLLAFFAPPTEDRLRFLGGSFRLRVTSEASAARSCDVPSTSIKPTAAGLPLVLFAPLPEDLLVFL
jgi:hypothetical protein